MEAAEFALAPTLSRCKLAKGRRQRAQHPGTTEVIHHDASEGKRAKRLVKLVVEYDEVEERFAEGGVELRGLVAEIRYVGGNES